MNTALILACLGIMLKGMVGIFIVILVIWGLVALLGRLTAGKKKQEAPAAPAGAASGEITSEVVAAVSAALAEELGTDVSGIRIKSMKKVSE